MKVKKNPNTKTFDYTYKICKGISKIKGGSKVLNELNYPTTIVNSITNTISHIKF